MNIKRYKKYIVVNEDYKPMTFQDEQFVFNEIHLNRNPFPVVLYTYEKATELIKLTIEYRIKNNFTLGEYYLMPVAPQLPIKRNT